MYKFCRKCLEFEKVIGAGEFGQVKSARAYPDCLRCQGTDGVSRVGESGVGPKAEERTVVPFQSSDASLEHDQNGNFVWKYV
jgi:hypothetical protein